MGDSLNVLQSSVIFNSRQEREKDWGGGGGGRMRKGVVRGGGATVRKCLHGELCVLGTVHVS